MLPIIKRRMLSEPDNAVPEIPDPTPGPGYCHAVAKGMSIHACPLTWNTHAPILACNEAAGYGHAARFLVRYDSDTPDYQMLSELPQMVSLAFLHPKLLRSGVYPGDHRRRLYDFRDIGLPGPQPTAVLAIAILHYLYPDRHIICWGYDGLFTGDYRYHPAVVNPRNLNPSQPDLLKDQRRRFNSLPLSARRMARSWDGTPLESRL